MNMQIKKEMAMKEKKPYVSPQTVGYWVELEGSFCIDSLGGTDSQGRTTNRTEVKPLLYIENDFTEVGLKNHDDDDWGWDF